MSVKAGNELGQSDVLMKLAVMLLPLAEEAVRRGMMVRAFEHGLLGGLLCTGNRVVDHFPIAQGNGKLGETIAHPEHSSKGETIQPRTSTPAAEHIRRPDTACSSRARPVVSPSARVAVDQNAERRRIVVRMNCAKLDFGSRTRVRKKTPKEVFWVLA
jgi:hypothetical protein